MQNMYVVVMNVPFQAILICRQVEMICFQTILCTYVCYTTNIQKQCKIVQKNTYFIQTEHQWTYRRVFSQKESMLHPKKQRLINLATEHRTKFHYLLTRDSRYSQPTVYFWRQELITRFQLSFLSWNMLSNNENICSSVFAQKIKLKNQINQENLRKLTLVCLNLRFQYLQKLNNWLHSIESIPKKSFWIKWI